MCHGCSAEGQWSVFPLAWARSASRTGWTSETACPASWSWSSAGRWRSGPPCVPLDWCPWTAWMWYPLLGNDHAAQNCTKIDNLVLLFLLLFWLPHNFAYLGYLNKSVCSQTMVYDVSYLCAFLSSHMEIHSALKHGNTQQTTLKPAQSYVTQHVLLWYGSYQF